MDGSGDRQSTQQLFFAGVQAGLPIAVGYLPLAVSFGVLAVQSPLSVTQSVLMSVIVYAGASQFMAVNMLLLGAVGAEVVLATFVVNFRHFIMSMSLARRWVRQPKWVQALLSLGVTDESFAVASMAARELTARPSFMSGLMLCAYGAWVSGTALGGLLSFLIPPALGSRMVIALYAMFIALLVPSVRRSWAVLAVAASGAFLNTVLRPVLGTGWSIIAAASVAALLGVWLFEDG